MNEDGEKLPESLPEPGSSGESGELDDAEVSRRCPDCGSPDIRPSWPRKRDAFFRMFGRTAYRCRACQSRFYLRKRSEPELPPHGGEEDDE